MRFIGSGSFFPGATGLASANALQPERVAVPRAREEYGGGQYHQARARGPTQCCHPQTCVLVWGKDGCQQVHLVPVCVLEGGCSAGPRGKGACRKDACLSCSRRSIFPLGTAPPGTRAVALVGGLGGSPRFCGCRSPQLLTSSCFAGEGDGTESAAVAASKVSETVV